MKTYFRLLSFAKPIEKFAIPYVLCTIFAVIFATLNLALLAPLLQTLFSDNIGNKITPMPASYFNIMKVFEHYVSYAMVNYGAFNALKFVCATIVVSVMLGNLFRYLSQRIMENLRVHTLLNLRRSVFFNVMDLHLGFFNNERKGEIISKIAADVQTVQYSVTSTLQVLFKEPLQLLAYMFTLFAISAKLTIFSLLVIPLSAFIIGKIVKRLKQQAAASQKSFGLMISYLDEALSGIKIIKAFNAVDFIKHKFHDENVNYSNINKAMAARQQLASPVSEFLSVSMVAGIVLYGGYLIINGTSELSSAGFIAYIAVFSQVMRPAKAITDSFSQIHNGIAAGDRVLELIDTKPAIVDKPLAKPAEPFKKSLEFKQVSFNYADKEILNNINLTVNSGETVALVGPSGGGKSTFIDLIPRFIEPKQGEILLDGININDLKIESVRSQMGIVSQESVLFNDTVLNNIAFGKADVSEQEVIEAAKVANAHDFIMALADGYQTNIGDRGTKLSGGQRQRLCIARAVLNNPPILLLDEATSALDTESEKLVQDALDKLMKNRTSIVIAHRLSTIRNADKIVVLDHGVIKQIGTHEELIKQPGIYSRLTGMQQYQEV